MKLIQSFLGRRQFLIGSMASASALAFKKLVTGNNVAMGGRRPELPMQGQQQTNILIFYHRLK